MKIFNMIIKDVKLLLSDKKALAIMILMPIILTTILSMALKGSFVSGEDREVEQVKIAVVKQYDQQSDNEMFKYNLMNNLISKQMGEDVLKGLTDSGDEIDPEEIFFKEFLDSP